MPNVKIQNSTNWQLNWEGLLFSFSLTYSDEIVFRNIICYFRICDFFGKKFNQDFWMRKSVFSRRFSCEKCPTVTVASFFFVRPQSSPCMYPFSVQTLIGSGGTQRSSETFSCICLNRRDWGVPFEFFGTDIFSKFSSPKGPPSNFLIFAANWSFKEPKGSPLNFLALWDCFEILFGTMRLFRNFSALWDCFDSIVCETFFEHF